MKKLVLLLTLSLTLVSCGERKDMFAELMRFVNELNSEEIKGEIVKKKADQEGYFVVRLYTDSGLEELYAFNYGDWKKGTTMDDAWISEAFTNGDLVPVTDNGNGTYTGTDGRLYEVSSASGKDLEKVAGIQEALKVSTMAGNFASNFGLSEERSFQVAKTVAAFNKISQSRNMTERDADYFTQEVMGVKFSELTQAVEGQNLNSLIEKAAEINGVSPEHMEQIISELVNN
jgi:hypothetical protein